MLIVWIAEAFVLYLLFDIMRIAYAIIRHILKKKRFTKGGNTLLNNGSKVVFILSIVITALFFAYGVKHNENYVLKKATISLPESNLNYEKTPFSVYYFSDLHIDPLFLKKKLSRMILEADSLKPDFIIFGGDLADITDIALTENGYDSLFKELTAKAKSYGITGNHEALMERQGSSPEKWMQKNDMIVLSDSALCDSNFKICIAGRMDFQMANLRNIPRTPLKDIIPLNNWPLILLDHQPKGIEIEYSGQKPVISLSGHTHDGQFFPVTSIIGLFWKLTHGFGEIDGYPWLVTSGIDSWGPPIRVGSDTEAWFLEFQ